MKEKREQVERYQSTLGVYKVRLVVGDVQRSLEFYQSFLGLRLAWIEDCSSKYPLAACLEARDIEFVLVEGRRQEQANTSRPCNGMALCIEVANIEHWFARAQQCGYAPLHTATRDIIHEPLTQPWGEISFALLDPDGYEVQIGQLL